jgi:hypothetical protein
MRDGSGFAARRVAAACLAAVSIAAIGCGDSDDGDSQASSGDGSEKITYDATLEGDDKAQIETTMRYLRERFNGGDGEGFCAKLTPTGTREVTRYGKMTGTKGGCAAIMTQAHKQVKKVTPTGQRPVYVSSITVDGSTAVIRMRGGLIGTRVAPLRLEKVDGEWKLIEVGTKKNYGG